MNHTSRSASRRTYIGNLRYWLVGDSIERAAAMKKLLDLHREQVREEVMDALEAARDHADRVTNR